MMIKISERLKSLVKYVAPNDKVMDVGCDHALLDIYLIESGILTKIYVGDVNPNALQNGKENIEAHELSSNIFPILSYGIEKANELDVDTLIISGMGSKTIIEILSSPNLDRIYKLILQSNNNHAELRRFLSDNYFDIIYEEVVNDGKKTYINIIAIRDYEKKEYTDKEIEFGPKLINNPNYLDYFTNLYRQTEEIYYRSKSDDSKRKLNFLEEIIKDLKNL